MDFEFGKANVVETLDKVPEQFRDWYEAGDGDNEGKFVLGSGFKTAATTIDGFNSTNKKLRTEVNTLKAQKVDLTPWLSLAGVVGLEDGEEATPEKIKEAIEKLVQQPGQSKANFERMKADLLKSHDTALKAKDGEIAAANSALTKYLVDSAATTAIVAEKGVPALLLPYIKQHVKVVKEDDDFHVRVVDDDGAFRGGSTGGHMTIAELVKELKADATFGRAFESEAKGSATGNPSARSTTAATTTTTAARNVQGGDKMTATDKIKAGLDKRSGAR